MGRLAEIAFVFLLIWLFFPSLARLLRAAAGLQRPERPARAARSAGGAARTAGPRGDEVPAAGGELVRCARCGVHFPRSRGLSGGRAPGTLFCSESCRRQGAAAPS